MCLDNNTASLSVRYVNAQFRALWENAGECASHANYTDFKTSEYEKSRYTRALGEFHFLSKKTAKNLSVEELFFHAKFAAPRLEFVCGHEAVLHLTIESGHLNSAYKDAVKTGARADKQKNCPIRNLEVVFRVPFLRTNVKGRDAKIGNAETKHLIQMISLQVLQARLLMYSPDGSLSADVKEALHYYMQQYLQLLENAGNHVFFDLPDFDDNRHRPVSNYVLIHNRELDMLVKRYSEEVKLLGNLECNLLSTFYDMHWVAHSSQRNEQSWGKLEICLATICSDWIIGSETQKNFFINFNKPIIEALCPREVIVKFHIKELGFFKEANICENSHPIHQYSDWKVAFIVDVFKPEGQGLLQLDLNSARFSRYHSYFGERTIDVTVTEHIEYIISFMQIDYLDLISRMQLHIIFGFPSARGPETTYYSESWSETDEEEESSYKRQHGRVQLWSERIDTTIYGGYDQVIALSEESINLVLRSRNSACSTWQKDRFFSMDVHPLSIRLLSNGKAIVYVQAEGKVGVKKKVASTKFWIPWAFRAPTETDELEEYDFDTITLAYEVDLKLQSHDHLQETMRTKTETVTETSSEVSRKTAEKSGAGLIRDAWNYITGNLVKTVEKTIETKTTTTTTTTKTTTETMLVIKDLSEVSALGNGDEALERFATVQHYLPQYLHELIHFGHNILHTVPVCKTPFVTPDIFAFTCVDFKVLTKRDITIKSCAHGERNTTEMPLVLLYGMCTAQSMTQFVGSWLPGLVPVGNKAVGTVALSHRVFLQRCLIEPLKLINEATTIVPSAADIVNDVWLIELCTWDLHKTRSQSRTGCAWELADAQPAGFLAYKWEHCDEWTHSHHGSFTDETNGEYKLACHTHNTLNIPIAYSRKGLEIVMGGKSEITLSGKRNDEKWTKRSTAIWSAVIRIDTTSGGLKVSVDYHAPLLNLVEDHPQCCQFDIVSKHRAVMVSKAAQFEQRVLPKLKTAIEHTWKYSTMGIQTVSLRDPVFTRKGDLICELDLNKDAIASALLDKAEWESHCDHIHATAASNGAGQIAYASGNGHSHFGKGNGNGYNLLQNVSPSKPTIAASGYSAFDMRHEQDSLSEDEEDHEGN